MAWLMSGHGTVSCVTVAASAGEVFAMQVDGYGGNKGAVVMNVAVVPPVAPVNDNFAGRSTLSSYLPVVNVSGSTVGATRETGEPSTGAWQ